MSYVCSRQHGLISSPNNALVHGFPSYDLSYDLLLLAPFEVQRSHPQGLQSNEIASNPKSTLNVFGHESRNECQYTRKHQSTADKCRYHSKIWTLVYVDAPANAADILNIAEYAVLDLLRQPCHPFRSLVQLGTGEKEMQKHVVWDDVIKLLGTRFVMIFTKIYFAFGGQFFAEKGDVRLLIKLELGTPVINFRNRSGRSVD